MKKISVKVFPNSKKDEIIQGNPLIIKVKAKAEKNQANLAVIKILKRYFKADIRIIKGKTSRKKIIEII